MFLTIVSGLSRTHGLAQGAHPLGARQSPPAAHQHAPKMAPAAPGPDRVLDPDPNPNPGPVPIEAHAGTTPDLAPVPTDAVPGAVLVAGSTAGIGATAVPPCQIVADTLATGPTQTPTTVWVCLD